jgi:nucleotide-binding universal stress UspA family protein
VIPRFRLMTYRSGMLEQTKAAAESGVACETLTEGRDDVYRSIIGVAGARACDLIVMASHGRRGIAGLLMGSQTQHVLTHGHTPVLVWR